MNLSMSKLREVKTLRVNHCLFDLLQHDLDELNSESAATRHAMYDLVCKCTPDSVRDMIRDYVSIVFEFDITPALRMCGSCVEFDGDNALRDLLVWYNDQGCGIWSDIVDMSYMIDPYPYTKDADLVFLKDILENLTFLNDWEYAYDENSLTATMRIAQAFVIHYDHITDGGRK